MTGPFAFQRATLSLDDMLEQIGGPGWDGLEKQFAPAKVSDRFDPGEDMKLVIAAFASTAEGRRILDWIADLTVNAPYPHVGSTRDSAWIAAAKHEARCAVGHSIRLAIQEGAELWKNRKEPDHGKTA